MFIRDIEDCEAITAGDNTLLRELLNPHNDDVNVRYSLAVALVEPGETSRLHRLNNPEVYFILDGEGTIRVGDETEEVHGGHTIYIPAGTEQQITNTGDEGLLFICIVDPAWREEDEEILEDGKPAAELEFAGDDAFDENDVFDDDLEFEPDDSVDSDEDGDDYEDEEDEEEDYRR